jgi:hypothetical protein
VLGMSGLPQWSNFRRLNSSKCCHSCLLPVYGPQAVYLLSGCGPKSAALTEAFGSSVELDYAIFGAPQKDQCDKVGFKLTILYKPKSQESPELIREAKAAAEFSTGQICHFTRKSPAVLTRAKQVPEILMRLLLL